MTIGRIFEGRGAIALAREQSRGHQHVERARDLGARVPMRDARGRVGTLDKLVVVPLPRCRRDQGDRQDPHE